MDTVLGLNTSAEAIAEICRLHDVRELSVFGSAVTHDSGPESDVDLLVSFHPDARATFLTLARMQRELEELLERKVDLVPKDGLKPLIRDHVLATAQVLYAA